MSKEDGTRTENPTTRVPSNVHKPIPWWLRAVIALGVLLLAVGGILALVNPAMLVSPHDEINGAVRIYAGYLASRNLALAIVLVLAAALRARRILSNLMVLTALIQLLDVCLDALEGRWTIVPGVFVFGLLFLVGSARLSGYPFWKRAAWTS